MQRLLFLLGLSLAPFTTAADTPAAAREAILNGAKYMRSISASGGYLWRYSTDLKLMAGEVKGSKTMIWIQPPGTPSMGKAFLKAYEATGEPYLLDCALAAGRALAQCQLESGGWDYRFDFANPRHWLRRVDKRPANASKHRNISTFDDNTSQSALRFLLALLKHSRSGTERQQQISNAFDYGARKLLQSQYPNGAWPQHHHGVRKTVEEFPIRKARYPKTWSRVYPKEKYRSHFTFNDNSHRDCVLLALEIFRVTGQQAFREAARRGGEFILLAQLPAPQPIWAQQYNAQMEPAWARKFEPPSVTGGESVGVCRTLIDLYLELGDERYLRAVEPAVKWFKKSAISKGKWARFYELKTNKPLYFTRDYKLVYTDDDLPTHYGFQSSFGGESMIRYFEKVKSMGREKYLAPQKRKPPSAKQRTARAKNMEKRVQAIIAAQDKKGRWVTRGRLEVSGMTFGHRIETQEFIANMQVLSDYLALLK
jgi:hypothetical protein